jgi:uncharacterized protein (DUF2249 family)
MNAGETARTQRREEAEAAVARGEVRELDIRPLLEAREEPFRAIMRAVDELPTGFVLRLITPFEPAPLFPVLARRGMASWSIPPGHGEGVWHIFFYSEACGEGDSNVNDDAVGDDDDDGVFLDVRGMEPPETLERVLEVAEGLAYGAVLRVCHHGNPIILFDHLAERGFACRSDQREDEWNIRIWRKK